MKALSSDDIQKILVNECNVCLQKCDYQCHNSECVICKLLVYIRNCPPISNTVLAELYKGNEKDHPLYKLGYSNGYQDSTIRMLSDLKEFIHEYD